MISLFNFVMIEIQLKMCIFMCLTNITLEGMERIIKSCRSSCMPIVLTETNNNSFTTFCPQHHHRQHVYVKICVSVIYN